MKVKSYAKINLALKIVGRDKKDGYHLLNMVNVPISLYDEMEIMINNEDDNVLTCTNEEVPLDNKNLVYKAIEIMREKYKFKEHFNVNIKKNIPLGGGVAGGSSNAAMTLKCVNELLNLQISEKELMELGFKIGADIPYCIVNKPSIVTGKGEIVSPFILDEDYYFLLVKGKEGLSTKEVYTLFDSMNESNDNIDVYKLKEALIEGNLDKAKMYMGNDLEKVSFMLNKEVEYIKNVLINNDIPTSMMTGSGAFVFALSKDKKKLEEVKELFNKNKFFVEIVKMIK